MRRAPRRCPHQRRYIYTYGTPMSTPEDLRDDMYTSSTSCIHTYICTPMSTPEDLRDVHKLHFFDSPEALTARRATIVFFSQLHARSLLNPTCRFARALSPLSTFPSHVPSPLIDVSFVSLMSHRRLCRFPRRNSQWTAWATPDPLGVQYEVMCAALRHVIAHCRWDEASVYVWVSASTLPDAEQGGGC